jgi:DNA-binding NtrC family response regulator
MTKTTVLIAQAEPNGSYYSHLLWAEDRFDVQTANSGLECFQKMRRRKPDVLVLDQDLPWGGGDGVLARMHDGECARVPVVLTHEGPVPRVAPFIETLVSCCLPKPYRFSELLDCIDYATSTRAGQFAKPALSGLSQVGCRHNG